VTDERASDGALIVVDVLNPYGHEDADALAESMARVVSPIAGLVERAQAQDVPVIYVNDNYGHWNSSSAELIDVALDGAHPELVEPLRPPADASFVVNSACSAARVAMTTFAEDPGGACLLP
jgi:nicotinamidase-related amidase